MTTVNMSWSPVVYDGDMKNIKSSVMVSSRNFFTASYKIQAYSDTTYSYQVIAVGNNGLSSTLSAGLV
ncbi:fibronectin type III domain-containing protein [Bacillus mycoides]|uniref:fibronectin type III domain-containing protein n=1 Tax=Bacillus mycoides TaxID=1405 RepID=UPI0012F902F3|nr:fibronectin type III domain-containing protein [Bacillus mycoides]